jgi:hypothetical protein
MRHALLLLACCALGAADQPAFTIPHGKDAPTKAALKPAILAWNHATLSAPLEAAPDAPGKAELLALFARVEQGWSGESVPIAEIRQLAAAAEKAGSTDAMLLYIEARFSDQQAPALLESFRKAYAALADAPYPPVRRAFCAIRIFRCLAAMQGQDKATLDAARDEAETRLVDALASIPDRETGASFALIDTIAEYLEIGRCGDDPDFGARWLRDVEAAPIAPWWRDMAEGIEHINLAWAARGGGWANTVTEEGWRGFGEHIAGARGCFVDAWKKHPDRPEPSVRMITVAMGGGDEDGSVRDWFERAVAAQLDCAAAYDHLLSALMPRWGGSHEDMLALGAAAAATERFDTDAPWQCLNAVRAVYRDARSLKQDRPAALDAEVYARCRKVMDGYRAFKPGGVDQAAWFASQSAVLAWCCGMPEETLHQLDLAGDKVMASCFDVIGMNPAQLRQAATAAAPAPAAGDKGNDF